MTNDWRYCWKCDEYIPSYRSGKLGLCDECRESLESSLLTIGAVIMYMILLVVVPVPIEFTGLGAIFMRILLAFLGLLAVMAGAVVVFLLGNGAWEFFKKANEWIKAYARFIARTVDARKQIKFEEAKQRALEADARRLDGAALDALLTEEYKQQQGWD